MNAAIHINPYYGKTSLDVLVAHYNSVLSIGPIIMYSIPTRTNQDIPLSVVQNLVQNPSIELFHFRVEPVYSQGSAGITANLIGSGSFVCATTGRKDPRRSPAFVISHTNTYCGSHHHTFFIIQAYTTSFTNTSTCINIYSLQTIDTGRVGNSPGKGTMLPLCREIFSRSQMCVLLVFIGHGGRWIRDGNWTTANSFTNSRVVTGISIGVAEPACFIRPFGTWNLMPERLYQWSPYQYFDRWG